MAESKVGAKLLILVEGLKSTNVRLKDPTLLRVEKGKVVLALLNSPEKDEEADVYKVLAEEQLAHFFANTWAH